MPQLRFTPEQMQRLAPMEPNFKTVIDASWCRYPGDGNIQTMLAVWQEATGSRYPFRSGCGDCIVNLVRDLGLPYFAQKKEQEAETAAKAAEVPAGSAKPAKPTAEPTKPQKPAKGAKTSKGKK